MVKREIATSFPLPDLRNGEDMAVIPVWMMHASKFFVISQPMYNYLLRKGSLSNNATSKVVNALLHSFSYICQNALTAHMHQVTYIGVRNVLYGALLNLFKCSNDRAWANCIVDDFEKKFPFWTKNLYLNRLPLFKRVFVKFVSKRKFRIVRLMCLGHQWLTER